MMNLANLQELQSHLSKFGLYAKKSFGQNFLVDEKVLDSIVRAADLQSEDVVVEVGPGPGVLSQRLAPHIHRLLAVEIDEKMIAPWKSLMKPFPQAEILNQDVLQFSPPDEQYKVIANIPYYITSPILKHFLRNQQVRRPNLIVLMIQKEVADRICDKKKPTLLSWEIRIFGEPQVICKVPPSSFYPSPKVDSAVLKIDLFDQPLIAVEQMDAFFQVLGDAYKQPRKTLLNNFCAVGKWTKEEVLERLNEAGIDPGLRPHQLGLEEWEGLVHQMY